MTEKKAIYRETPCACGRNMFYEIDMMVENDFGVKHATTFEYCVDCHALRVPYTEAVKDDDL